MATVNVVELEPSIVGRPFIQAKERRFKNGPRDPVQPDLAVVCPARSYSFAYLPILEAIRI